MRSSRNITPRPEPLSRHGPLKALVLAALAGLAVSSAAACTAGKPTPQPSPPCSASAPVTGPAYTLRILGGSELADMQPILAQAARATGVTVQFTPTGTLDGSQIVTSGQADGKFDAIWFSSNRYIALHLNAEAKLSTSTDIMLSPVILGLQTSVAHRLGWDKTPVGWAAIATAANAHLFSFGMTNPARSNSGLSALVGIATAIAGNGAALNFQQVEHAAPALRGFFSAQALTASSSGYLTNAYLRRESGASGPAVDGLVEYESELLSLNASGKLREQLSLIYPKDGIVMAEYPLTLLASAPEPARAAYTRLVTYLREPGIQREIMQRTWRRPIISCVHLDSHFATQQLFELPFPASPAVIDGLTAAYFDTLRRPARTLYILDVSGSMAHRRIADLKTALAALTGVDPSLAAQADEFHGREQIIMLPFSTTPGQPIIFDVPEQDPQPVLKQIRAYIASLTAGGWTAIYDSLVSAYSILGKQMVTDPDRITSIVLLTDGENNTGRNFSAFVSFYRQLPPSLASIPIFPILFGENNTAEMRRLAALTGGHSFDARTQSLATAFADIRGDQ